MIAKFNKDIDQQGLIQRAFSALRDDPKARQPQGMGEIDLPWLPFPTGLKPTNQRYHSNHFDVIFYN